MEQKYGKYYTGVGTTLVPIAILLFSILTFVSNVPYHETLLVEELHPTHENVIKYLQYKEHLDQSWEQDVAEHFEEVRGLLTIAIGLLIVLLALIAVCLFYGNMRNILLYGSIGTGGIVIVLAIMPFSPLFTLFHELLFTTVWQYPLESAVIQLYGGSFFPKIFAEALKTALSLATVIGITAFSSRY